ncbi:hypothetical protein C4K10_4220 [Pseudomonas chlororaphis subsp. aureofaciens]|nr:hypothetical protein C4K10_4220 [Pseudomonas chlororaphis subsp. aureofaciens]AZE18471.1 hypothetical protein C4K09_4019 [Pseudomonas chlororaphis subsp. aureofaciens]
MWGIEHWLGHPYGTDEGPGKLTPRAMPATLPRRRPGAADQRRRR